MELSNKSKEIVNEEERLIQEIFERLDDKYWGEDYNKVNVAIAIYINGGNSLMIVDEKKKEEHE